MKIIAIGDIHGRKIWTNIDLDSADKVVFLGDYFDPYSYAYDPQELIFNFMDIISLKKRYPEKYVLLLGNHDGHYVGKDFLPVDCDCRSIGGKWFKEIRDLFRENIDLFQFSYQPTENLLFTHAGLCGKFLEEYLGEVSLGQLSEHINNSKGTELWEHLGDCGPGRWGPDTISGIFWADFYETSTDQIEGLTQVIGHSRTIAMDSEEPFLDENNWYIDSLENGYYLELQDGIGTIKRAPRS